MTTEIQSADALILVRTLNATVAKVWEALTDVDQMREWYFDLKEFRPEVGFEFGFVDFNNAFGDRINEFSVM